MDPREVELRRVEMAATAGDDEPLTRSGNLTLWARLKRRLRSVLMAVRKP